MLSQRSRVYITRFTLVCTVVVILYYGVFLLSSSSDTDLFSSSSAEDGVDQGCYHLNSASGQFLLSTEELARRKCNKTFPDVIVAGTKKCGTTALRNFLTFHPQLATAKCETHYFDSRYYLGLDWYLNQMPFSTPDQLTVEKTPGYFVHPFASSLVKKDMDPKLKLIFILRDPVQRAISDFAHSFEAKAWAESGYVKPRAILLKSLKQSLTKEQLQIRAKFKEGHDKLIKPLLVKDTFEESVLFPNGTVNTQTSVIDTGIYIKHLRQWLSSFPLDTLLVLDGEEFIYNPLPALQKIEQFLNIKQYFTRETFYFDTDKTFFCLAKPLRSCMSNSKGRPHPYVQPEVLRTLYDFFEPYNIELEKLLQQNFTWTMS